VGFYTATRGEDNGIIEFEGTHASLENLAKSGEGLVHHFVSVLAGPTKQGQAAFWQEVRYPLCGRHERKQSTARSL
jgi:hypothetical protein